MKIDYHDFSSIHKVGNYEFLAKAHYIPSLIGKKKVNISIELTKGIAGYSTWKRSVTIDQADVDSTIEDLIASYFEETDYFRITPE